MQSIDVMIDVTEAARIGEPVEVAVTVHLPDPGALGDRPVVCIGKPGGGYSRGYYTADLPGPASGSQAAWHAERGWIFVSVDHLGVGDSTIPSDTERLGYTVVAAGNQAAEQEVLARLAAGSLVDGFPSVSDPLVLGIGQSMGGCMTVIQQGRYHCYDGIGVLGYSAVHTTTQTAPGVRGMFPWIPRDVLPSEGIAVASPAMMAALMAMLAGAPADGNVTDAILANDDTLDASPSLGWGFHYDDVDPAIIRADLDHFPTRGGNVPAWGSGTLPTTVAAWCMAPGAIAPEAAAVGVPVLVAMGERDVIADPRGELRAYQSASSVDFYVCPRMGHMHNFAGTRELFWRRIETWADWVRVLKDSAAG
jgi:alpha-beta hydrolase superfamily lysophospholipase